MYVDSVYLLLIGDYIVYSCMLPLGGAGGGHGGRGGRSRVGYFSALSYDSAYVPTQFGAAGGAGSDGAGGRGGGYMDFNVSSTSPNNL